METNEKHEIMFIQLIAMFQATAMQYMGKLKDPYSGIVETNLQQAQFFIDLLDMLAVKTKGNLAQPEERMLSSVLQDLKLNYVDEINKQSQQPKAETTQPEQQDNPQETTTDQQSTSQTESQAE